MNEEEIKRRIDNLNVWKRGDQRAPHKPLLLLYALGRCARGESRLVPYREVHEKLRKLLEEFGPPRKAHHPNYPYWRLENDGLWELAGPNSQQVRERPHDPSRRYLFEHDSMGGFPEEIHSILESSPDLIGEIADQLLQENFPRTLHEDVLDAVGLDFRRVTPQSRTRDPAFREKVLRAYSYQCGVCGFDLRLENTLVAVEAAHVKWHQAGGPDVESNGIALCSLHHKLFDRGVFTVSRDEKTVQVSEAANGSAGPSEWILDYHGESLRAPQRSEYAPDPEYLDWHSDQVFRPPARKSN